MDDKLVRLSDVIQSISAVPPGNWSKARYEKAVASIPAVDAVEVVRCKDCRYFCKGQNEVEAWEWCDVWKKDCWSDCYCASGQRREDGDA